MLVYVFSRLEKGLTSFFVFGIFATIYYVSIPFEMLYTDKLFFIYEPNILLNVDVERRTLLIILAMAALSLLGFATGYMLSGFKTSVAEAYANTKRSGNLSMYGLVGFLGALIMISLVLFRDELRAISSYHGNVETKALNPAFNYIIYMIIVVYTILQSYLILSKRISFSLAAGMTLISIAWSIYSSDKDPLLLGLLPMAIYLNRIKQYRFARTQITIMLAIVVIIPIMLMAFSEFRSHGSVTFQNFQDDKGLFKLTDARGGMHVAVSIIENEETEMAFGKTYLESAVLWIPRKIWPDRPLDQAQKFAINHMKDWLPGQGLGYSPIAEAYQNFGLIGGFLHFLLFGFAWGVLWNTIRRFFFRENLLMFNALYSIYGVYMLIIIHRGASNAFVTTSIQTLIPLLFIVLVVKLIAILAANKRAIL
ncbi:MAG: O-antigen polysaccharide polymerase Wzy [Flavobacteriales bacterium]|nr:O-antigen polysaccharide polymerase Wzy [Flavobacteriales bacterium]